MLIDDDDAQPLPFPSSQVESQQSDGLVCESQAIDDSLKIDNGETDSQVEAVEGRQTLLQDKINFYHSVYRIIGSYSPTVSGRCIGSVS